MNKSITILLVLALVTIASCIHLQARPSNGSYPSTNTQAQTTALINGQPYYYTGDFTLACWLPSNTNAPYRWDTCRGAQNCYNLIMEYSKCQGTVKKYPPRY